jgi:transcriptional regulator with XRE-family HTH domain
MSEKTVMANVHKLVEKSGLTQQVIGERMGYPASSARKSVSQFLKSTNPTIGVLTRFAKAMKVKVERLL